MDRAEQSRLIKGYDTGVDNLTQRINDYDGLINKINRNDSALDIALNIVLFVFGKIICNYLSEY